MKRFLLPVVLLLVFVIGEISEAHATHIMGVDLTYECIAPGQYRVHLQVFRDCNGILPSSSYSVPYSSVQCGVSSSVTVTQVGPPVDITPVCSQNTTTACNGAGTYGVQKYTYEGIMNLPVGCGNDWILSWSSCCRNGAITDLTQPLNENIYISDCLDNTQTPCVSSPVFLNNPIPFFCVGVPVNYNHGVVDVAGDSLVFTNVCCLNAAGSPVSYLSPFSCSQPFATTGGGPLVVNHVNGNITFTPNVQQIGVMAVTVDAYRNGVLVSCVTRDMQFTIIPCTGYPPTATGFGGGNNYTFTLPACADTCLKIYSADSGGAAVTMTWDHGIPGGTLTTAGSPDPVGTFCWSPSASDTGLHSFTVTVANNNCPITGSNTYAYSIRVVPANDPPVIAGPDTTLCPGQAVTLSASVPGGNPTSYAWSDGTNNWSTQNITVNPVNTTQYTVTAFFLDGCEKSANVLVTRVQSANISIFPGNISLCSGGAVNLIVSTTATNPTYHWSPTAGLSCTNCPNPVATPAATTQYCVSITDQFGCPSNTVCSQINFSAPPPPQACSVIYATTTGNGNGTKASPTNLAGAIALAQCNNGLIKLATGTYTIDNPISNITSYTTIEGGFDPATWVKTSLPGATTIFRSLLNPEGPANAQRIVAIYLNSQSYFRFQDLTVQTADCPASLTGNGWSNYVFHLTNCSNYNFVRCQIKPGASGGGLPGIAGVPGLNGSAGAAGSNGTYDNDPSNVPGGSGGAGAGVLPGSAGAGGTNDGAGAAGGSSGDTRSGGGGGGGAAGGYSSSASGSTGGNGGGINGGGGTAGAPGGNVSGGTFSGTGSPGANGVNGNAGAAGTAGAAAGAPAFTGGFYTPGAQGGNGTDGGGGQGGSGGGGGGGQNCTFCVNGTGNGAGGGGGGAQGGTAGTGGWSGGVSVGVYLFNNGVGGVFVNDDIFLGTAGLGGLGGTGGTAGNGGAGGAGATLQTSEIGAGGNGGTGGNGGAGGNGGSGVNGSAVLYYLDGGSFPAVDISFNLAAQPVIDVTDVNCTYRDVNFTSAASGNWAFDTVSNPPTATGASVITQYNSSGRKNITYSANVYQGFFNVPINANSYIPDITTTAHQFHLDTFIVCKGSSANFTAVIPSADIFDWDFGGAVAPNTYTGPNFQNLSNLVFNTTGIFKIKVRISTACCGWSPYDSIWIIVDQTPVLGITGLRAFCPGDSTTLTATGASFYHWTPPTGLNTSIGPTVIAKPPTSPVTYLVKGYSAYGYCIADTQITITINHPPALTFTTNPATCGGNGSVTVVPNPAGIYTYNWNDPSNQTTPTATALGPGAYIVTVTDPSSNCTVAAGVGLSAGTGIQAYIDSSQDASCHGYCDGVARVKGIGASGSYNYHWSNAATSRLITGLCAGTYSVTVTDVNATCTATATVIIGEPAPLAINFLDTVNATCPDKNNGSAFSNASGGTGPFQYLWNDPNLQDSSHAIHLFPGLYTVIVVDQHGCVDSAHVPITSSPPVIADTVNVIDVSCFGLSDGAITLHVTGGLYPYTYAWQQLPAVTDSFPQNIVAGNYTAYITDGNGCIDTLKNIPVKQPAQLVATAVADSVKCFGGSTGGVVISGTGGTVAYQYSIDGINFQASGTFTGLAANNYTATIKDAHGCMATAPFTVYQPNLLTATLAGTVDDLCFGDNTGSATITITGGTLNYTAVLGAQTLTATPFKFTGLAANTYTINVTDANNCTATVNATINQPQQLVLTLVSTTAATCYGQANGGLTVSAAGGTPAYAYSLNGGTPQASPVFTGILGGLEIVGVTDANNCVDTLHINVPQPPQTTFLDTNVVDVVCFGQSNGSIDLIVTGTGGPWTYTWSTGANTQDISNLPIGTYSVTVVEAGNCTAVGLGSIVITQPPVLAATDVVKNDSCFGSSNGCITVTTTGGSPVYSYAWSVAGNGAQLCNLPVGSYDVTVSDTHLCSVTLANILITQPALLTVTDAFTNVSCPGKSDGSITAIPAGGTQAYSYTWSNGAGNVNPAGGLPKRTYDVTVTDANNCTASVEQVIIELPGIMLGATVNNVLCPPLHNGLVELTAQTNNPPASFVWSNGAHSSSIFSLGDGTYSVTVTDANNCEKDTSFHIITLDTLVLIVSPHDTTIDLGNSVAISVTTNGVGGNIASILWMPPGGLNCSDCVGPVAFPIQNMSYVATVVSDSGCVAVDTSNIIVIPIYEIYIPNAFTPNGDGNNDFFEVFGNKALWKEFEVQVFDRIGEKVFQSNDMNFKWDGTYKNVLMNPAVFVYQIHLTYINNHTEKLYKGSVTLVR